MQTQMAQNQVNKNFDRIILASLSEQENLLLRKKIEPALESSRDVRFTSVLPQGLIAAVDDTVKIVILNLTQLSVAAKVVIREVRRHGYQGPVIITAKSPNAMIKREFHELENVMVVEKPFSLSDLQGLIKKLMSVESLSPQQYRRFQTSQEAKVEFVNRSKQTVSTKLLNLSRGGCYLELKGLTDVKAGEILNVTIELNEVRKTYQMPAKVVWTQNRESGTGVGVAFVGPGQVESQLLSA